MSEVFKSTEGLINSGGSHHLCPSRSSFKDYSISTNKPFSFEMGQYYCQLMGEIGWGYYVRNVSTNEISVGQLSETIDALLTLDPPARHK